MIWHTEHNIAAISEPTLRSTTILDSEALLSSHADRKVCVGQYEDMRYFVYGSNTLLIILREKMHDLTASNVRSRSVRCSEFELWQVYDMRKSIRSICFNPKYDTAIRSASGVIAVVLAGGTGVLMTPTSNSAFSCPESMVLKQHEDASRRVLPSDPTPPLTKTLPFRYLSKTEMSVNDQYVKCHLHLRASKWYETARWQAEDTHLNFIEWAEFGQDVYLIGAGELISVWKVVEDEVQLYFQRSFDLCGTSMTPHSVVPHVRDQNELDIKELADRSSRLVSHFGVSPNGKYAATARRKDRIIKLWSLHEYNQLGMPQVFFLGCHRRIHSMQWCAERHNQKPHFSKTNLRNRDAHDMLVVLDHKGSILIWRSSKTTNAETFVLCKEIAVEDRSHSVNADLLNRPEEVRDTPFLSQISALPASVSELRLVEGSHIHKSQLPDTLQDSLCNERNILTALSRFHFGYCYLEDVRKNELCSQLRTETLSKMNKQLLGERHGYLSDTHAGESVLCGNLPLVQTIQSYLLCAVCRNGDLCLIRMEDAPYSGISPRVPIIYHDANYRPQLRNAQIYSVSTADYKEGKGSFTIEIIYQGRPVGGKSSLETLRLRLQAEYSHTKPQFAGDNTAQSSIHQSAIMRYIVQSHDIAIMCKSLLPWELSTIRMEKVDSHPLGNASAFVASGPERSVCMLRSNVTGDFLETLPQNFSAEVFVSNFAVVDDLGLLFFHDKSSGKLRVNHILPLESDNEDKGKQSVACASTTAKIFLCPSSSQTRLGNGDRSTFVEYEVEQLYDDIRIDKTSESASFCSFIYISTCEKWKNLDKLALEASCILAGLANDGSTLSVWLVGITNIPTLRPGCSPQAKSIKVHMKQLLQISSTQTQGRWTQLAHMPASVYSDSSFCSVDNRFVFRFCKLEHNLGKISLVILHAVNLDTPLHHKFIALDGVRNERRHLDNSFCQSKSFLELSGLKHLEISPSGHVASFVTVEVKKTQDEPSVQAIRMCEDYIIIFGLIDNVIEAMVPLLEEQHGSLVEIKWMESSIEKPYQHSSHRSNGTADQFIECNSFNTSKLILITKTTLGILHKCVRSSTGMTPLTTCWSLAWSMTQFSLSPTHCASFFVPPFLYVSLETSAITSINIWDQKFVENNFQGPRHATYRNFVGSVGPQLQNEAFARKQHAAKYRTWGCIPIHHPLYLLFFLSRGSFVTLEMILEDFRHQVIEYDNYCYLNMTDDIGLTELKHFNLNKILNSCIVGTNDMPENMDDEARNQIYVQGKQASATPSTAGPFKEARASDLFSDFRPVEKSNDRADLLFSCGIKENPSVPGARQDTKDPYSTCLLATEELHTFMNKYQDRIKFWTETERYILRKMIEGIRFIFAWVNDVDRKKDEASLRFCTSLLWPFSTTNEKCSQSKPQQSGKNCEASLYNTTSNVELESETEADQNIGLVSEQIAWALITDYQTQLIQECLPVPGTSLRGIGSLFSYSWALFRQWRLPFWVHDIQDLVMLTEKAAQVEYTTTKDPFAVALLYVLLGKSSLVANLFKVAQENRICDLFRKDFKEERWQHAAIKNAHVLKAKQRYELAAAFFLLGNKAEQAMSVAQYADPTLVTSFLIARIVERWSLKAVNDMVEPWSTSSMHHNTNTWNPRNLNCIISSAVPDEATSSGSDSGGSICLHFLKNNVLERANACNDVYMCFIVNYLTQNFSAAEAVESLLRHQTDLGMKCFFRPNHTQAVPEREVTRAHGFSSLYSFQLYWHTYCRSLLSACSLVRFLMPLLEQRSLRCQKQIPKLQIIANHRLRNLNLPLMALYVQKDLRLSLEKYQKHQTYSLQGLAIAGNRLAIYQIIYEQVLKRDYSLGVAIDNFMQSDTSTDKSALLHALLSKKKKLIEDFDSYANALEAFFEPHESQDSTESTKRLSAKVRNKKLFQLLACSRRVVTVECLLSTCTQTNKSHVSPLIYTSASMLSNLVGIISDGIMFVGSGDLLGSSTELAIIKRVDQVCLDLLGIASNLLRWIASVYARVPERRENVESIRIVSGSIYSVICICLKYSRSPCCIMPSLRVIFPHKEPLSNRMVEEWKCNAMMKACPHSSQHESVAKLTLEKTNNKNSIQEDISVLYKVIDLLTVDCKNFIARVKAYRSQPIRNDGVSTKDNILMTPSSSDHGFCVYWTLLLSFAACSMSEHVSKITFPRHSHKPSEDWNQEDQDVLPTSNDSGAQELLQSAKRLVQAWIGVRANICKLVAPQILFELVAIYCISRRDAQNTSVDRMESTSNEANESSTSATRIEPLHCSCRDCPWIAILSLIVDKNELLTRLSIGLKASSDKIRELINWGYLPQYRTMRLKSPAINSPQSTPIKISSSSSFSISSLSGGRTQNAIRSYTNSGKSIMAAMDLTASSERKVNRVQPQVSRCMGPHGTLIVSCMYRGDESIKAFCINNLKPAELIICSSKSMVRAVDAADSSNKFVLRSRYVSPTFRQLPMVVQDVLRRNTTTGIKRSDSEGFFTETRNSPKQIHQIARNTAAAQPSPHNRSSMRQVPEPSAPTAAHDMKASHTKPTALRAHPYLPFFVSGNHKGKLHLWAYDKSQPVCEFKSSEIVQTYSTSNMTQGRRDIKRIQFDTLGQQMGVVDMTGHLCLWNCSKLGHMPCHRTILCHDKGARSLTFVNSATCVATVGSSSGKQSVCVWDLLLPTSKALIASPICHPAGTASVVFSSSHQLLISGGEGGGISIFDVRQRRVLYSLSNAHETAITTLELHPENQCVLSGSASGDVKIWSIPIFKEVLAIPKLHTKTSLIGDGVSTFLGETASNMAINVTNSSWGVTDALATRKCFYTCGTDGSVQRICLPSIQHYEAAEI